MTCILVFVDVVLVLLMCLVWASNADVSAEVNIDYLDVDVKTNFLLFRISLH